MSSTAGQAPAETNPVPVMMSGPSVGLSSGSRIERLMVQFASVAETASKVPVNCRRRD